MTPSVPQRFYDLAEEHGKTEDPERRRQLKDQAYEALVKARITSISRMVRLVREHFGEGI